jgi:hypothetical protein
MKNCRHYFFRPVVFSILLALVLSMCGCSATAGNIFGGHKVDERVNVSEAKGPETAYAYEGKTSFGKWNPDTILPLFFGEETVEEKPSNRYVRYTVSDGSYLHLNLH